MENEQYLKHKKEFKLNCILKAVGSGVAILTLIFLIFVPNFKIDFEIAAVNFSLFDEIKLSLDNMKGGNSSGSNAMTSILSIYQIIALVYVVLACCMGIFTLIKNIINLTDLDSYSLQEYDKIKNRNDEKKKGFSRFSASNLLLSGIILEILYIVMSKVYSSMGMGQAAESYFELMNGVSWMIMFFIIFAVVFIGISIFNSYTYKKVKMAIIKEDYGMVK